METLVKFLLSLLQTKITDEYTAVVLPGSIPTNCLDVYLENDVSSVAIVTVNGYPLLPGQNFSMTCNVGEHRQTILQVATKTPGDFTLHVWRKKSL